MLTKNVLLSFAVGLGLGPRCCPGPGQLQALVNYTHNAKLRLRFFERMDAYQCLWSGIRFMCHKYVRDVEEQVLGNFSFLDPPAGSLGSA